MLQPTILSDSSACKHTAQARSYSYIYSASISMINYKYALTVYMILFNLFFNLGPVYRLQSPELLAYQP